MICDTILDAMGHAPLVRLNRMTTPDMAEVLVRFEAMNVGGSIKTRTAERYFSTPPFAESVSE